MALEYIYTRRREHAAATNTSRARASVVHRLDVLVEGNVNETLYETNGSSTKELHRLEWESSWVAWRGL